MSRTSQVLVVVSYLIWLMHAPVQHAITPKFSAFVENLMKTANVPGITLGIVHTSGEESPLVELNAWGRKSEEGDGHDLATDVSIQIRHDYVVYVGLS